MRTGRTLALVGLLLLGQTTALRGDGGTVRLAERCGAYQVTVFTQPTPWRAGPVDVSILVQDAATGQPMSDAQVSVRLTKAETPAHDIRRPATRADATNKLLYAALFDLPEPGWWRIEVVIEGRSGTVSRAFDLEATAANPAWWDLIFWIAAPVVPIVLFTVHQVLVRRRTAGRNSESSAFS